MSIDNGQCIALYEGGPVLSPTKPRASVVVAAGTGMESLSSPNKTLLLMSILYCSSVVSMQQKASGYKINAQEELQKRM